MARQNMFILVDFLIAAALFAMMMAFQEAGRRLGQRDRQADAKNQYGPTPAEAAVYGLLGLLVGFTFSGAGARYEARHHLLAAEANAIGTAWLRIDVLPAASQPRLRDLMRQYLEVRIENSRSPSREPQSQEKMLDLQNAIWSSATAAAKASGEIAPSTVLLPALNEMIDITTTREQAKWLHPPVAVWVMLGVLALIGSLFAGYGMAGQPRRWLHTFGFAAVLSLTLFVIVDYEFPRVGFIRLDAADSVLVDLRRSMK